MQLGWAVIIFHALSAPSATMRPDDMVQQLPTVYAEKRQCEVVRAHIESGMQRNGLGRPVSTVFCAQVYAGQPVLRR